MGTSQSGQDIMQLTSGELLKILNNSGALEDDDDLYDSWEQWLREEDDECRIKIEQLTGLKLELVVMRNDPDDYDWWEIIFKANDTLFKISSWYSSYDMDTDYSVFKVVKPIVKTYTAYIT